VWPARAGGAVAMIDRSQLGAWDQSL
jgi:hypothetical protein